MVIQLKTIDKQAVSDEINKKSDELEYELGSALSYNSFDALISPKYPIAFIGLNPGGKKHDKPTIESENGKCAYYYENWTEKGENKKTPPDDKDLAPLQQQVIKLYKRLADIFGCEYTELMDKSIMANLVPFRSPSWNALPKREDALEFSRGLWASIFDPSSVKVIICMSGISFQAIGDILREASYEHRPEESFVGGTGWGKTKYHIKKYSLSEKSILLIRLPHLSRYKLLNSDGCNMAVEKIIQTIKEHIG